MSIKAIHQIDGFFEHLRRYSFATAKAEQKIPGTCRYCRTSYNVCMKMVEAITGMTRTYTFVFDPDPEGGFVVTCPALPGLVTHGATIEEARMMAHDAMEGYIEVLIEDGEEVPESDAPQVTPRFDRLAHTLRAEKAAAPIFEQLSAQIATAV